ncbi:MAG TPA: metallophosphoesterase [Gemmatimonadaceae bacterium]|nr:metallophosphoesterase [Gemmatimonadaceae bacterium]
MKRHFAMLAIVAAVCVPVCATAQDMKLPVMENSVRFLVIGDAGTGDREQNEVAAQIVRWYNEFPFTFALMLGDNIYGKERPQDFARKFERPYKRLLDAGVKFHAALGNHDDPNQRYYKPFNLDGKRYRTFKEGNVRFFILDSNYLDPEQVQWLEKELDDSESEWKIVYFHHPLYTTARRGPEVELRAILEPIFVKHGVDVVFTGHEHIYERFKPQRGIHHFVVGGGAKLRRGDTRRGPLTAAAFDRDRSFMIVAIVENKMFFQVVSRGGAVVDEGIITNRETADATQAAVMPLVRSP